MPGTKDEQYLRPWSQAFYRIQIEGLLEESWSDCFAGMGITYRRRTDQSVVTCLTGRLMDQSELMGVLNGLAEMHLPILLVNNISKNSEADLNHKESQRANLKKKEDKNETYCVKINPKHWERR